MSCYNKQQIEKSLLDIKVYRGAAVNSDRYMLSVKVKLKLMAVKYNKQCRIVYDINRLKLQEVRRSFSIELKNRFAVFADLEDKTDHELVKCSWKRKNNESYTEAAKKDISFRKKEVQEMDVSRNMGQNRSKGKGKGEDVNC